MTNNTPQNPQGEFYAIRPMPSNYQGFLMPTVETYGEKMSIEDYDPEMGWVMAYVPWLQKYLLARKGNSGQKKPGWQIQVTKSYRTYLPWGKHTFYGIRYIEPDHFYLTRIRAE